MINIVAAASVFIPAIMRLSRRIGMSPSRLLMPLAATALAGANLTIIGASHNLVVNSQLRSGGIAGFRFSSWLRPDSSFSSPSPSTACFSAASCFRRASTTTMSRAISPRMSWSRFMA
ncbi:MAG: hypothetical protein R3A46_08690 [Thermomicrobiales bacterium]